jgi:hypothetical protein
MSKKPDTASALAGILKAKRGDDLPVEVAPSVAMGPAPETQLPPSPALLPPPSFPVEYQPVARRKAPTGKSADKANYSQFSVYLRKDTRKKVGRALDDDDTGQDFSELVQELLEKWLASRT